MISRAMEGWTLLQFTIHKKSIFELFIEKGAPYKYKSGTNSSYKCTLNVVQLQGTAWCDNIEQIISLNTNAKTLVTFYTLS